MENTAALTTEAAEAAEARAVQTETGEPSYDKAEVTLFIAFGIGNSYIFHVRNDARAEAQAYWQEIIQNGSGWSCEQFRGYNKPLGWTATLALDECADAGLTAAAAEFRAVVAQELKAEVEPASLRAVFSSRSPSD